MFDVLTYGLAILLPLAIESYCPEIILWQSYRQISNISRTKHQNLNVSRLGLLLSLPNLSKTKYQVENEDVVGAALTGDAPTTYE